MSDLDRRLETIAGDDEWARHQELESLRSKSVSTDALHRLVHRLGEDDAALRNAARAALTALAAPGSVEQAAAQDALRQGLRADHAGRRILSASALGEAGDPEAGPPLMEALDDPDTNVRTAAADALGELRYGPALDALADLARNGDLWGRAAAVVALGRLGDERAVPILRDLADAPGLEMSVIEAMGRIKHPDALPVLERLAGSAPRPALRTAGAVLSAHPETRAPEWVRSAARREEAVLRHELVEQDEPAVARLLGLAGTATAVESLISLTGPPRRSEAALAGLLAAPPDARAEAILGRLPEADEREAETLLAVLPPLTGSERTRALLPFLSHEAAAVRSAAAEALARSSTPDVLRILEERIERDAAPEVIRAVGALGETACTSLVPLLSDPAPRVRAAAASALTRCAGHGVAVDLEGALEREAEPEVREALIQALARAAGPDAMDKIEEALASGRGDTRIAAIQALGMVGDQVAIPSLERALEGRPAERLAALHSLGLLGEPSGAAGVARFIGSGDADIRRAAARAAVRLGGAMGPDAAERMAEDQDAWIRACGARVLGAIGSGSRDRLTAMAREDPDPDVRTVARQMLEPASE